MSGNDGNPTRLERQAKLSSGIRKNGLPGSILQLSHPLHLSLYSNIRSVTLCSFCNRDQQLPTFALGLERRSLVFTLEDTKVISTSWACAECITISPYSPMVRILLWKQQQPPPYPNLCTFWVRTSRKTPILFSPEPPHIVVLVRKKAVRVVATIFDILEAAAIDRISLAVFPRTAEGAHQHFIGVHVAAAIGAHGALPARGWPSLVRSSSSLWLLSGTTNGWKRTQSRGSGEIASTPGALTALLSPPPATLPKRLLAAFRDATPRPVTQGPAPPIQSFEFSL